MQIRNTELAVSRFIFGTAGLFNVGGARARQKLLFAAVDAGFSHFDTAPYYGFGVAERDLGQVLKARPEVTVTTKVGLYSPGGEGQPAASVFLRKAAGRVLPSLSRPSVDFSLARAQRALDDSLRRLQRETIDLYVLHEPVAALVQTDEWAAWSERLLAQGKIRGFGLALTADRLAPFLQAGSPLAGVVQVHDSLEAREADILARHGRALQITYGYVSAARKAADPPPFDDILRQALRRNAEGAIIVSTGKLARLGQYSRLVAETDRAS